MSRIALLALLRAMWQRLGEQVRIPTPGSHVSRALFGALNIRTGRWVYQVHEHMYKEDFIAFLEQLLLVYAPGVIILVVVKSVPFAQASVEEQARRLRSLCNDILHLPESTDEPQGGCARCSAQLDLLVSDWLDGVDVARRHPAAWQHLQVCQRCREEFESLADLLAWELEGVLRG